MGRSSRGIRFANYPSGRDPDVRIDWRADRSPPGVPDRPPAISSSTCGSLKERPWYLYFDVVCDEVFAYRAACDLDSWADYTRPKLAVGINSNTRRVDESSETKAEMDRYPTWIPTKDRAIGTDRTRTELPAS